MRAVVQRVHEATVVVADQTVAQIGSGLLLYVGVAASDTPRDAARLADKVRHLRVFPDEDKPLNRDVVAAGGAVLAVSAFTTQADARKGRRPALSAAAAPELAQPLFDQFCNELTALGVEVYQGRFREHMDVRAINDGPVCILLDTAKHF
jgi:D-tyrosyl-tRNA(Tyr) deacylase